MIIDSTARLELSAPQKRHINSMRELWKEAFGDSDEFLDSFFDTAFSPARCRVALDGDEVLGALYIFDCEYAEKKIAYIYAVATRAKARGQGICKRLMDDTHKYLADRGYIGAILVPSEPSLFGFYEKLGYETCSSIGEFCADASAESISIIKIEKEEYKRARRLLLPKNSVLQEKYNIDFLATYASFYKGNDFVLACYRQNDKLRCAELLGNSVHAPAILRALECATGSFRVPPQNLTATRTFAMYFSIDRSTRPPEYFGLAFD